MTDFSEGSPLFACAQLVERGDPDRFVAAMSAPPGARAALFPLYAFNLEVSRAPWVTEEPMIAEMRLQWWRDALEEIGAGGPVRRHEVVEPLADVIGAHALPIGVADGIIAARRWDIYREPFEDAGHFTEHIDRTFGGLTWLAARALGADDTLEVPVRDAAWGQGVAAWLCAVPSLIARGRQPLLDDSPEAVAELARQALARIALARKVPVGRVAPALRQVWQAERLLRQAVRDPARVQAGTLGGSDLRRRIALGWVALRGRW